MKFAIVSDFLALKKLKFIAYCASPLHNIPNKSRFFPKNPGFSLPKPYIIYAFINTQEPGEDAFNKRLSEHVAKIKDNEKFRSEYRK